jgi:hypothetical protein
MNVVSKTVDQLCGGQHGSVPSSSSAATAIVVVQCL